MQSHGGVYEDLSAAGPSRSSKTVGGIDRAQAAKALADRWAVKATSAEATSHLEDMQAAANLSGESESFWKAQYINLVKLCDSAGAVPELTEAHRVLRQVFDNPEIKQCALDEKSWPAGLLKTIVLDTKLSNVCGRCGQTKHYAIKCFVDTRPDKVKQSHYGKGPIKGGKEGVKPKPSEGAA